VCSSDLYTLDLSSAQKDIVPVDLQDDE